MRSAIHRLGAGEQHQALARDVRVAGRKRGACAKARVVRDVRNVEPRRLVPRTVGRECESSPPIVRRVRVTVEVGDDQIRVVDDEARHGPRGEHEQRVHGEQRAAEERQRDRFRARGERRA